MATEMHEMARRMRQRGYRYCPMIDSTSRFAAFSGTFSCSSCSYNLKTIDQKVNANKCVFTFPLLRSLIGRYAPIQVQDHRYDYSYDYSHS